MGCAARRRCPTGSSSTTTTSSTGHCGSFSRSSSCPRERCTTGQKNPAVIDLHCHILPGLDDGPANMDFSLAMARAAVEANIQIAVATPHVRADYEGITPERIAETAGRLNARIEADGLPLRVIPAGE